MFKKLHSNRDPGLTVFGELKKEFSVYFNWLSNRFTLLCNSYPRPVYGLMVLFLLVSALYAFRILPLAGNRFHPEKNAKMQLSDSLNINAGFDQLLRTAKSIKESIRIKQFVEALLAKDTLSHTDSVQLERTLDRLQEIQKSTIP